MINPNQQTFVHCPKCGKPTLGPRSKNAFACSACGFVFYLNCAAACIAVIVNQKNQLLVTRRKKDPFKGTLDLPGGFAEPAESIEQSLIREIKEELNLDITRLDYLCSFPNTYPYKSVIYPVTDMAFVCEVSTFDTIDARDDIAGFYFVDLASLDKNLFGMDSPRKVVEYYQVLSALSP
ncbi:MAG: NUDIX domain-containing protein [Proteobacteria bacterium]|nr:NUDIX domain-containing protein [Pseudomonadota bacterium]